MISLTLPDGTVRNFDKPVTGAEFAASIGAGLARAALAVTCDGQLQDLSTLIERDGAVAVITARSKEALPLLRHDAAHVMAEAVQELYPDCQVTFGPATETGFYYDFARDTPFSTDDLAAIEQRMHDIVDRDEAITREAWDRATAIAWFEQRGEHFKAEWITQIAGDEPVTIYRQGQWLDLCRGPHLPSTGRLGHAFRLMKVSGAYWRGDKNNAQLQRITGTCWPTKEALETYLFQLAEAERRDHRRIGREMDLFHLQEEAPGQVFWHPKGWTLFRILESFIRDRMQHAGYAEVKTPQLIDRALFCASGHWDMYGDNMYKVEMDGGERIAGIKPMNCPGHVQIFRQGIKSYRDLPVRYAEFGACHRNEPSGALHGIMRVRAFTQDDGHIFCTPEQSVGESARYIALQLSIYRDLGFDQIDVKLALRPVVRGGDDASWDLAEGALRSALDQAGLAYEELPGEGAFYGPKIEFHLHDSIGRTWQCGTLQYDAVLPERLDASYIGEDGARHRPVMLHRAVLGSLERFLGILIEQYAGRFPLWLAPIQLVIVTITRDADDYATEIAALLAQAGIRVETDLRNETINYKVREHSLKKIPLLFVVGKREAEARKVAQRRLGGESQVLLDLDTAISNLREEAAQPGA